MLKKTQKQERKESGLVSRETATITPCRPRGAKKQAVGERREQDPGS